MDKQENDEFYNRLKKMAKVRLWSKISSLSSSSQYLEDGLPVFKNSTAGFRR